MVIQEILELMFSLSVSKIRSLNDLQNVDYLKISSSFPYYVDNNNTTISYFILINFYANFCMLLTFAFAEKKTFCVNYFCLSINNSLSTKLNIMKQLFNYRSLKSKKKKQNALTFFTISRWNRKLAWGKVSGDKSDIFKVFCQAFFSSMDVWGITKNKCIAVVNETC